MEDDPITIKHCCGSVGAPPHGLTLHGLVKSDLALNEYDAERIDKSQMVGELRHDDREM